MRKLSENNWFFICIAIAIMGLSLAVFGAIKASHSQDLSAEQIIDISSTAKVGDIIQKKDNIEIRKADNKGKLNARIYSEKQYDKLGNPLISYDSVTKKVSSNGHYVKYIPDTTTGKLTVTRTVSNNSIKEYITVPSKDITELRWTIETDLKYKSTESGLIFDEDTFVTPPPVAWDANKNKVSVDWKVTDGILLYTINYTEKTVFPVTVDPTITISEIAAQGGYFYSLGDVYSVIRNAASLASIEQSVLSVGQHNTPFVRRSIFPFVISSTLNTVTINACSLCVYIDGNYSTTDFGIDIFGSNAARPILTGADYSKFNGWQASGAYTGTVLNNAWNTSGLSLNAWNKIVFNSSGIDSIKAARGDTLWLALLSDRDVSFTEPTTAEWIQIKHTTNYYPYLSINYTIPPPVSARKVLYNNEPFYLWKNGNNIPLYKK